MVAMTKIMINQQLFLRSRPVRTRKSLYLQDEESEDSSSPSSKTEVALVDLYGQAKPQQCETNVYCCCCCYRYWVLTTSVVLQQAENIITIESYTLLDLPLPIRSMISQSADMNRHCRMSSV